MTLRQDNKEIYWAWKAMKQRCQNERCHAYRNYGARGITVCELWQEFEPFLEWALSAGWQKGLDLNRVDNNSGYCPDNCEWTTRRKNTNNRRNTTYLTIDGVTLPRSEWEDLAGIPSGVSKYWIGKYGKEHAEARISEALECGYKLRDFSRGHCIAVRCVETGELFRSIRDAAAFVGVHPITLGRAVRSGCSVNDLHFAMAD